MTTRVITKTATFARPFVLKEIGDELPAGVYVVETEEEVLGEGLFLAYRRLSTHIFIRSTSGETQMWAISPDGLESAMAQDKSPSI